MKLDFKLTDQEIVLSKRIFNDKIVRFIVSNGVVLSTSDVDKTDIENTLIVFFPENQLSFDDANKYIEIICNTADQPSIIIITNSLQIITAAPKSLCKIAKIENNNKCLIEPPVETFAQNLFEILLNITDQSMSSSSYNFINKIIKELNNPKPKLTAEEKDQMLLDIDMIGEAIIRNQLRNMFSRKIF